MSMDLFSRNARSSKGFTLVEILLVASILSVLSLALFHTFTNGLKIWERSRQFVVEEDISILFDKMGTDLRNCYFYSTIPFKGNEDSVSFATRIRSERFPNDTALGQVEYYYNREKMEILRRESNYGRALAGRPGKERKMAGSIKRLQFAYFYPENSVMSVQPQVNVLIPSAVAIEVDFEVPGGTRQVTKLILISTEI